MSDRKRNSNKMTLTLTLSRPTGEGTARPVFRTFQSGWIRRPTEDDSPSPIRPRLRRRLRRGEWERAGPSPRRSGFVRAGGVRVSVAQIPKLFLHESLASKRSRNRARAAARWLILFFTSSPNSAKDCSYPSGMKSGSYPNPPCPRGANVIRPGHTPSNNSVCSSYSSA